MFKSWGRLVRVQRTDRPSAGRDRAEVADGIDLLPPKLRITKGDDDGWGEYRSGREATARNGATTRHQSLVDLDDAQAADGHASNRCGIAMSLWSTGQGLMT